MNVIPKNKVIKSYMLACDKNDDWDPKYIDFANYAKKLEKRLAEIERLLAEAIDNWDDQSDEQ